MDRIEVLEEKVAHLIRAVDDLSDVLVRREKEVDRLTRLVGLLVEREAHREVEGLGSAEAECEAAALVGRRHTTSSGDSGQSYSSPHSIWIVGWSIPKS